MARAEPSRNRRDIAQKALDAVAGVDLNPFAVAISRFRLLVAALLASDVHKLSEAPDFQFMWPLATACCTASALA